jgi:hypothetical protein
MFKSATPFNEIIGLTVMLLMIAALVASQADARIQEAVSANSALSGANIEAAAQTPPKATIKAHVLGHPLTITIEKVSEFSHFSFDLD